MSNQEEWRVIEQFPSYEVSSYGNVRNRNTGRELSLQPKRTKKNKETNYLGVHLYDNSTKPAKTREVLVSRLVAAMFIEQIPMSERAAELYPTQGFLAWNQGGATYAEMLTAHHKDMNKQNNHVDNIEIITHKENIDKGVDLDELRRKAREAILADPDKIKEFHKRTVFTRRARSKIPQAEIENIKQRLANGETGISLAKEYGVSTSFISMIKLGQSRT